MKDVNDVNVMKAPSFDAIPGVAAVFIGRGAVLRPEPASLVALLGPACAAGRGVVTAVQVHSERVLLADERTTAGPLGEGDAIVTRRRDLVLGIATADCLPIVAVDPAQGVLAVVHAGWRGTVAGVLERALQVMAGPMGARLSTTRVAIGPSARSCCYRVGSEVIDAFTRKRPEAAAAVFKKDAEGVRLDLVEANRLQALQAGVPPEGIEAIDVCSICRADLCHSYRRDGERAGRMWLLAALTSP